MSGHSSIIVKRIIMKIGFQRMRYIHYTWASFLCICTTTSLAAQQVREVNIWDQLTQRVSTDLGATKVSPIAKCQECGSIDSIGEHVVVSKKSGLSLEEAALPVIKDSQLSQEEKSVLKALVQEDKSLGGVTIIGDNFPNLLWALANGVIIASPSGLKVLAEQLIEGIQAIGLIPSSFNPNSNKFIDNGVNILKEAFVAFSKAPAANIDQQLLSLYTNANTVYQNSPILQTGGGIIAITTAGTPVVLYLNEIKAYNILFTQVNHTIDFNASILRLGANGKYLSLLFNAGSSATQAKLSTLVKYANDLVIEDFVNRAKYHGADANSGQLDYIVGKTLGDTIKANKNIDFGKLQLLLEIIKSNYATPAGADVSIDVSSLVAEFQLS